MPWTPDGWVGPRTYFDNPPASSEAFGDVEFRSELDPHLSKNPLARLGYNPKTTKVVGGYPNAAYIPAEAKRGFRGELRSDGMLLDNAMNINRDDVVAGVDVASPPIFSHEYTHKGLGRIIEFANEDIEYFQKTYGKEALGLLRKLSLDKMDVLGESMNPHEYVTELMDDTSAPILSSSRYDTMKDTGKSNKADDGVELAHRHGSLLRAMRGETDIPEGITDEEWSAVSQVVSPMKGILQAAQDLLTAQGEPPQTKPKEKGFIESLFSDLF